MIFRRKKEKGIKQNARELDPNTRCKGCDKWGTSHTCLICSSNFCSKCILEHKEWATRITCALCNAPTKHWCGQCKLNLCAECYRKEHDNILSGRYSKKLTTIVGNRCDFCGESFIESKKANICSKCIIIVDYNRDDPSDYFRAWNRVLELIQAKRFNIKHVDEHYYEDRYGRHVHDVVTRAIKESRKRG